MTARFAEVGERREAPAGRSMEEGGGGAHRRRGASPAAAATRIGGARRNFGRGEEGDEEKRSGWLFGDFSRVVSAKRTGTRGGAGV